MNVTVPIEPRNAKALIDLGDHYRNLDANDKAIKYYKEAAITLRESVKEVDWKKDVEELRKAVVLLVKHERVGQ